MSEIFDKLNHHFSFPGWIIIQIPGMEKEVFHTCKGITIPIRARFLTKTNKVILCPNCFEELPAKDIYSKMPQLVLTLIRKSE